jgi:hydrophobe/amphiphile efflux-1 (HAE1) family protein
MSLSDLSIRRPVFAWMMMAALVIFGGISFSRLGVSQLPDVDFPVITVSLSLEGAAPEIMESDVVDPIEDVLTTIEGVREISSTSREGAATVTVEFELERNIDLALQDVQTKIAQAQRRLPRELDPPLVTKSNPEDNPILWLGLSGTRSPGDIADYARYTLRPRLQTLPGVAEVMMGGFRERNMRIWLDREKLEREGVTVPDVIAALSKEHVEIPAGRVETAARERNVRAEGEALTARELKEVVILNRGGDLVRLRDVAGVEPGLEDKRRIARVNGLPAIGLGVKKQRGANAVEVARRVKAEVEKIKKTLPADYDLGVNFDGTKYIEDSTKEIEFAIVLAVGLTAVVCWIFLGSWSATLNVVLAIPTSLVGVCAAFYFLGFTLNTFTLLGISLAVGIVVDDAIMVLENIYRHHEMGKDKVRAAREGAREITFAAIAATVAIIAIFLPVAFMKGIMGKFFFQFGITLSLAVALSLLEALTLTPMRSSQFMSKSGHETRVGRLMEATFRRLAEGYGRLLGRALAHPVPVLVVLFAAFAASLEIAGLVGKEFVPPQDQGIILARMLAPVGSSIDYTDERLRELEKKLVAHPEVARYFGAVGGFGGGEVNTAILFVTMVPPEQRTITQQEFMAILRKEWNAIPDVKAFLQDLSLSGFSAQRGFPVEFSIRGPSFEVLAKKQDEIMDRMRESGLFLDIDSDYLVGMPEIRITPERDRAADLGVSMEAIGETVQAMIGGIRVGKFKEGGHRYDMRMRLEAGQRVRAEDVARLYVRSKSGELVRLDQVVRIDQHPTLLTVNRRGRERSVSIFANVAPGASQDRALAEVERIALSVLPEGYKIVFAGSAQTFRESFQSLMFALVLGIVVAYMVLASQFNSYLHPVTVLLALPFSVTGALIAIWLAGKTLNIYSMIGLILLMGIVKKNSIILVDYTNQRREEGLGVREALLAACPVRLRPILMTSIATVAAAVPAALVVGPGGEVRAPMAVAVIGGVTVSTLLTLFVVPCFYIVSERAKGWLRGRAAAGPQPVPASGE